MPKSPDYWLYNEDCFETFKRIPDGSVDLVLVDPPYGTTQCRWDSVIPLERLWPCLLRLAKLNAAMVFTSSQPFTSVLITSQIKLFRHEWIWIKNLGSNFANTVREPFKEHELVCIFSRGGWTYNKQLQERTESGKSRGKYLRGNKTNTMNYGRFRSEEYVKRAELRVPSSYQRFNRETGLHPTQKPVALMEYLAKTYSNEGDTVLDFAMGSGTTGVACGNLNRKFIGCDNDVEHGYFEIAKKRIAEAYRKQTCP